MGHCRILHYVLVIIHFAGSLRRFGGWCGCVLFLMSQNGFRCSRYRLLDVDLITDLNRRLIKPWSAELAHVFLLLLCLVRLDLPWLRWLICILDVWVFTPLLLLTLVYLMSRLHKLPTWHAMMVWFHHLHLYHLVLSVIQVPTLRHIFLRLLCTLHIAINV